MNKSLVILCGGDSSRMGSDKALLPFKDKTMVEYIYDRFAPHYDKVYLSVNEWGDYTHLGLDVQEIPDIYRNAGPMGGILSSLTMITEEKAFFMPVDTPFMDPALGLYLYDHSDGYDITTFKFPADFASSVCAVYSKHCIAALGKCILAKNVTRSNFQSKCYTNSIPVEEIANISHISMEQQLYPISDRNAYYMALFSILKHNFVS